MYIKGKALEDFHCEWCNKVVYAGEEVVKNIYSEMECCSQKCHDIHNKYIENMVYKAENKSK